MKPFSIFALALLPEISLANPFLELMPGMSCANAIEASKAMSQQRAESFEQQNSEIFHNIEGVYIGYEAHLRFTCQDQKII